MKGRLNRSNFRTIDKKGEKALQNWIYAKKEIPPHLILDTKSETVTKDLQNPNLLKEAKRIVSAKANRAYNI
jgi:hypothetical protein